MKRLFALLLLCCALTACASQKPVVDMIDHAATVDPETAPENTLAENDAYLDDSAFDAASSIDEDAIADPLEPWNRMWFAFNDVLYMDILKPVYTGYEAVVHEDIRSGLSNALRNLNAPVRIVNSILQLEFAQATVELGRFLINSTFGGLGLMDLVPVEKALVPVNLESADFGGTLAKWGMGEGLYLVWPVLGPSSLRDSIGFAGDYVASPTFWTTTPEHLVRSRVVYATTVPLQFNSYGAMLDGYETLTRAAVEPYSSLRNAWIQMRRNALLKKR